MLFKLGADLLVILHLGFICFVVLGGFMLLKWRWLIFVHLPAILWAVLLEFQGWICPLTHPWNRHYESWQASRAIRVDLSNIISYLLSIPHHEGWVCNVLLKFA